jgi:hypothetical protein
MSELGHFRLILPGGAMSVTPSDADIRTTGVYDRAMVNRVSADGLQVRRYFHRYTV